MHLRQIRSVKFPHLPNPSPGTWASVQRAWTEEDEVEKEGDHEDWIDNMYCFTQETQEGVSPMAPIPYTADDLRGDQRLDLVKNFLANALYRGPGAW